MILVDGVEMADIDGRAQDAFGIPGIVLMENAARSLWERYTMHARTQHRDGAGHDQGCVFVAGAGNNGGDALAMARHAHVDGRAVEVVLMREALGELGSIHASSVRALGIPVAIWPDEAAKNMIRRAVVIFDGLFGTGLRPPLKDSAAEIVHEINRSAAEVIAIDVPSGIGDGYQSGHPAVRTSITLTVELPKRALYLPAARPLCGEIEIVPIGFPKESYPSDHRTELVDEASVRPRLPVPHREDYKGSRGRVGVFAGASGTTGASVLCASAAGRVGAGLVYLHVDQEILPIVASHTVSVMPRALPETQDIDPEQFDALLVGPGWGQDGRMDMLTRLIAGNSPGVLDADGLNLLAKATSLSCGGKWILTPHPGEMSRLSGYGIAEVLDDPYSVCAEVAERYEAVVLLKSHVTFVVSPDGEVHVLDGMNPRLGTGGSGDVLAGIAAGLLARGLSPEDAAVAAAFVHAEAGRLAGERGWFLAEDLLPIVSHVTANLEGDGCE